MKKIETGFAGLYLLEPSVFHDSRGLFFESFRQEIFDTDFVQDNFSRSEYGVLRGLHYQDPHAQAKLVWVTEGEVYDVVVDLRRDSKTFGQHYSSVLSAKNNKMLFIPEGFAHGFCVTSDGAGFFYKCSEYYSPASEKGLRWDDPSLGIKWPIKNPTLSDKDLKYPAFIKESF